MLKQGNYSIELFEQTIVVRFFNSWTIETSLKMCEEFQKAALQISDKPWACIVDLSHWDFGGPDVWEPILKVNDWCTKNGQAIEAVICINELQKHVMEVTHKALPKTESAFFNSEVAAKKWLNDCGFVI